MRTARRIQLGILAVVFVAIIVAGVFVFWTVKAQLIGQVDDQLAAGAQTMEQFEGSSDTELVDVLGVVGAQPDRASALLLYGADDELLLRVASGTDNEADPLPDVGGVGIAELRARTGEPFGVDSVDGSLPYRAVSVTSGDALIVFATPIEDVRSTLAKVTGTLLLADLVSLLVIGLATTVVIRRAISPIDDMIDVAAAIGSGDLGQRIDTSSHDVDVRRLSGALNDMLHQLEGAFDERTRAADQLRQFVADASHELRTPLSSIRGYAELYTSGAATDTAAVDRAMDRIQSEAIRTGSLVEDLLLLARLDQGREFVAGDVDMARLVSDAVDDARAIEPERAITLDLSGSPLTVRGDGDRLRQVVTNLLANTRAHAPGSAVHVDVGRRDDDVILTVSDQGPGLTVEQAEKVFDRFWQGDPVRNRRTGGSGLGLAIIDAIVRGHHGAIRVESTPGTGATFVVRIPVDDGD